MDSSGIYDKQSVVYLDINTWSRDHVSNSTRCCRHGYSVDGVVELEGGRGGEW
jgi:hypothetical protein